MYADPIPLFYRADSRGPEDVFINGFTSWGNNINFYAHVTGHSTEEGIQNSAFIATTASLDSAMSFVKDRVLDTPGQIYYIYVIRPTNNFYSVELTVEHLYSIHNKIMHDILKETIKKEQEYAALSFIAPQQIKQADEIKYNLDTHEYEDATIDNQNYNNIATYANANPYTGSDSYPLNLEPILFVAPPLQSASFQSDSKETNIKKSWPFSVIFNDEL